MILIVNTTSDRSITEEIRELAAESGFEPEVVESAEMNISHCIGCNHCWMKTPGVCS